MKKENQLMGLFGNLKQISYINNINYGKIKVTSCVQCNHRETIR